jgi:hypothetical protein
VVANTHEDVNFNNGKHVVGYSTMSETNDASDRVCIREFMRNLG